MTARRIFCNRTLNLKSIQAIGYDMDYTLIHYRTREWEERAYHHVQRLLLDRGWPVDGQVFDHDLVIRGLVIDLEHGNVVKANRFGFVKHAFHGTKPLEFKTLREVYAREIVDLSEPRWQFLNTLFSLSEAVTFMQLVDLLDEGRLTPGTNYADLYRLVRSTLDRAHLEGKLKGDILADPDRFVDLDENTALALLDQHYAGKKLILATNSEWAYTLPMMHYAFDRFLPGDMTWRELFDLVIVEARKPAFFDTRQPAFEVVDDDGLLRPFRGTMRPGGVYLGGTAADVERCFDLDGEQILYVGDHIFSDVHVSKSIQRWRTALVLRELEDELEAVEGFAERQVELERRMADKERLELDAATLKLALQRAERGYGSEVRTKAELRRAYEAAKAAVAAADEPISPLAASASKLGSEHWGLLLRAGNDKSHLARQVERYADIYMARVSDLAVHTPFAYLRSARGSLPHDPERTLSGF